MPGGFFNALGVHPGLRALAARDLPGALAAMRDGAAGQAPPIPIIVFHGDQDTTVNPKKDGEALIGATGGRLIRRRPGRQLHRSAGARRGAGDAAVLPGASPEGSIPHR
jgi:poly(3-hydroxybutyrate) depolymerase